MLFSDFRAQVRRTLEEPTANVWSDTSLLYWTNEATIDIQARVRQETDESYTTTVVGTSDYSLPDFTQEITAVYYNGYQLEREIPESQYSVPDVAGTPAYYQRMDDIVRLRPTPDAAKELLIIRKTYPATLTLDTDEMPFRSERATAMEYFVLSRAFEQVGDWQSADAFRQRYEAAVSTYDIDSNIAADSGAPSFPVETY